MSIILLIIYIVILLFLIINFRKCLKSRVKWGRLFIFEIFSTIFSIILLIYYDNLPGSGFMPGLTYLSEVLLSFGAMILYSIIFGITLITKLIIYLLEKNKEGKNFFSKIALIIAVILLVYGTNMLILDLGNDINVVKTNATIVSYGLNELGYERPIIEYSVDNKIYTVMVKIFTDEFRNSGLNDTVEIYYNKRNPSELAKLSYYENIYIPCFLISLCLFSVVIIKSKNNMY